MAGGIHVAPTPFFSHPFAIMGGPLSRPAASYSVAGGGHRLVKAEGSRSCRSFVWAEINGCGRWWRGIDGSAGRHLSGWMSISMCKCEMCNWSGSPASVQHEKCHLRLPWCAALPPGRLNAQGLSTAAELIGDWCGACQASSRACHQKHLLIDSIGRSILLAGCN